MRVLRAIAEKTTGMFLVLCFVCSSAMTALSGKYDVILDEHHFRELMMGYAHPPLSRGMSVNYSAVAKR